MMLAIEADAGSEEDKLIASRPSARVHSILAEISCAIGVVENALGIRNTLPDTVMSGWHKCP